MRISDWSSDVCSSDLGGASAGPAEGRADQPAEGQIDSGAPVQSVIGNAMKMTRNRMLDNFNALLGLVLLGLFAGLTAGPALAQAAGGATVSIQLNKLEPKESACPAYLVVKQPAEQAFASLTRDPLVFQK